MGPPHKCESGVSCMQSSRVQSHRWEGLLGEQQKRAVCSSAVRERRARGAARFRSPAHLALGRGRGRPLGRRGTKHSNRVHAARVGDAGRSHGAALASAAAGDIRDGVVREHHFDCVVCVPAAARSRDGRFKGVERLRIKQLGKRGACFNHETRNAAAPTFGDCILTRARKTPPLSPVPGVSTALDKPPYAPKKVFQGVSRCRA